MTTMIRFNGCVYDALNQVVRVFVDNNEILAFKGIADSSKRSIIALVSDKHGNPVEIDGDIFPDAWEWRQITGDVKIFLLKDVLTDKRCIRNKLFERAEI
jgi:hypothetical protein